MTNTSTQPRYQLCYDHDCPLCVWYTGYFQQHGYLKKGEAVPFHACDTKSIGMLNQNKMTNEIPLINHQTQEVLYGPDAMLHVIAGKYPTAARLANKGFARLSIDVLYKLISYNRKVIVGKIPSMGASQCNPMFHAKYRIIFIAIIVLIASALLATAASLCNDDVSITTFIVSYIVATAGSFWYLNKRQQNTVKIRLEIVGQIAMLLLLASVGVLVLSIAFYVGKSLLLACLLFLLWHIVCMQPQFFRRLRFVFFRTQDAV